MSTFQEIQDNVASHVIDTPPSTLALIPVFVKRAHKALMVEHNFKVMEAKTASLVTVAGSHILAAVPGDFKEVRSVPYLLRNDGTTKPLAWAESEAAILSAFSLTDTNDTGEPRALLDGEPTSVAGARSFLVYPFSDTGSDWGDGQYRIVVPYWKFLPALSSGADVDWFTTNADEYLEYRATFFAFIDDWDESRAQVADTIAQAKRREAISADKRYRMAGVDTLVVRQGIRGVKLAI